MATKESLAAKSWSKDNFYISTDISLIPVTQLNEAFASEDFYWAKPLPETSMREMLKNSLCFGLYEEVPSTNIEQIKTSTKALIGFARLVTDFVTFAYLTDVWVDSKQQGKGHGKWLIKCVKETVEEMPELRRLLLLTGDWERSVPYYERELGASLMRSIQGQGLAVIELKGKGHPSFGRAGDRYV